MDRRKPSHITIYILVALVLVAVLGIGAMQGAKEKNILENRQLLEQVASLEQDNLEWEERIASLGDDESVEQLARERLHWVYDQEVVYIDAGEG